MTMLRTTAIDMEQEMAQLAADMRRVAKYGHYTGRLDTPEQARYFRRCEREYFRQGSPLGTRLLFTRDHGMHDCGWWKNPAYNQCLHLSLSFFDLEAGVAPVADPLPFPTGMKMVAALGPLPQNRALAGKWCELFFGDWSRLLWAEPPFSSEGKRRDVWHYRVFTDPMYTVPLLPWGEVYSRGLTERGWKSWSDLHAEPQEAAHT